MSWKVRLLELTLAGGTLAATEACWFTCNANPDPCCSAPDSPSCVACTDAGGRFDWTAVDGGAEVLACVPIRTPDAGTSDGGTTDAG